MELYVSTDHTVTGYKETFNHRIMNRYYKLRLLIFCLICIMQKKNIFVLLCIIPYDESRENLHGKNIINFINLGAR